MMKAPKKPVCSNQTCYNNAHQSKTLVCSARGKCASCRLHSSCVTNGQGMAEPVPAVCGNASCTNSPNGLEVLVCARCGKCVECTFHMN